MKNSMKGWKTYLCVAVIAVVLTIYLRHGGQEKVNYILNQLARKLSYWNYKCSLWRDTERVKRSYRYIICDKCGGRNRIKKDKGEYCYICTSCNREIKFKKKGKGI